ncbi:MAG: ArsR/SmtB family transcription factor [Nitrososphaerota archaeon]
MDAAPNPTSVAALIGEPARATILLALLGGQSLPATDLAYRCRLTPQTISTHLARLVDGGLLSLERNGRHKYYRLASPQVGQALEALNALAQPQPIRSLRQSEEVVALRFARTCYDHLAGTLGVGVTQALGRRGYIEESGTQFRLTAHGSTWLHELGIDPAALERSRRTFATQCLDWSERRHHIGGALGAALAKRFFELGWIARSSTTRAVRLTATGRAGLLKELDIQLPEQ